MIREIAAPSVALIPAWAGAFAATEVVEGPIYFVALSRWAVRPKTVACAERRTTRALLGLLPSLVTHPLLWFVFPLIWSRFAPLPRFDFATGEGLVSLLVYGAVGEGLVVLVEALVLSRCGLSRPLLWSLIGNLASAALGLLVMLLD